MSESKIKCNSCGKEYEAIFAETNQGNLCDSDVIFELNEIRCSYGSDNDTDVYGFVNGEIPDWVEAGSICDECIHKLGIAGQINLVRSDIW